jgi:hypothetical protein
MYTQNFSSGPPGLRRPQQSREYNPEHNHENSREYNPEYNTVKSSNSEPKAMTQSGFQYNGRVAAVLMTSLVSMIGAELMKGGGTLVSGVLMGGCMIAYVLDAMQYREGSFLAVWVSLILANLGLAYTAIFDDTIGEHGLIVEALGLLLNSSVLFLIGSWASLQYKWIHLQYPAVVIAFEKILMTGCIPTGGALLFWGLIVHNGLGSAPFLASAILCVMYAFFARPLRSSFSIRGVGQRTFIQRKVDAAVSFIYVLLIPSVVYIAAHNETIVSWVHLWSIFLLFCGPLLFMSAIPKGLWWLGDSGAASACKRLLVLVSFAGVLAGIEGRILFRSFGQYINIAPPFSYIAITAAMYGVGAIFLLYLSGTMGDQTALILLGPISMLSTAIGCLIIGVPIWVLPAPLIAAAGVTMYSESRSMRDYSLIVLGGLTTAGWFLWHHFWFLDIELDGMHLRTVCGLIFLAMIPAFAIPGLCLSSSKSNTSLIGAMMMVQASVVAILEEHLYAGDYLQVTYDVHPMFPASLVVATTGIGIYITRKLYERSKIGLVASFVVECVYGAKLSMILVPETRLAIPVIAYALASLHPLFLGDNCRKQSMNPTKGILMACGVVLAVAAARFAVFDSLHILLDRKPSESVAAGSLLLAVATGLIPMLNTYYAGTQTSSFPKRAVFLAGSLGILLILLRPPLPIKGGAECPKLPLALCPRLWDASHTPEHEVDDVAVYGDGLRRREHWPLWFVVAASFSGILASTSAVSSKNAVFAPVRLIQGTISGALIGGYMALEFFPGMYQVQVLAAASCVTVSFIVVLLSVPSKGSAMLLPLFGFMWLSSIPCSLFVLEMSSLPPLPHDMVRLHPDVAEGAELDLLRRSTTRVYLVSSIAAQALIISFAGKLRLSSSRGRAMSSPMLGAAADAAYIDKAADFLGGYVSSSVNRSTISSLAGVNYHKIREVGMSYLPEVCNLVTVLCYALCLWLNNTLSGEHMPAMIIILSAVLLLLSQDSLIMRQLTDKRRYFPPYLAGSGALLCAAMYETLEPVLSFDLDIEFLGANVAVILLSSPSVLQMIKYLWYGASVGKVNAWLSMLTGLVAVVVTLFSDVVLESAKTLLGVGLFSSIVLGAVEGERKKKRERAL